MEIMSNNGWNSNDWANLGRDIRDVVEQAVNSQDFRQLNETICRTVTDGLDNISDNIRKSFGYDDGNKTHYASDRYRNGEAAGPGGTSYRERKGYAKTGQDQQNNNGNQQQYRYAQNGSNGPRYANPGQYGQQSAGQSTLRSTFRSTALAKHPLYARTFGEQAGGTALTAVGYTFAGGSSVALMVLAIVGMVGSWTGGMAIASGILGIVLAGSSVMAWQGTRLLGRVRRFRKYVDGMKGQTFCNIKELAALVGKKEKFVVRDVKKMIRSGWFRQGHLDRKETCLIVSHETYRQYEESQRQLEARQRQELADKKQRQAEDDGLSAEVRDMIRAGNEYIDRIEKSNDAIPGEEISNKISRMQMIVEKIFQRVKEHPEYADDLRKFMDYYLPTTVKLLDAYEELDRQPVQGDNIKNGKAEIEKTLDTLNVAFEKLLDSLFEDTAWDVSTDISVLKTMLAQEGLTESGLKRKGTLSE